MRYVVLSEGQYEDYDPRYYEGKELVTEKEMREMAEAICMGMREEWEKLEDCIHWCSRGVPQDNYPPYQLPHDTCYKNGKRAKLSADGGTLLTTWANDQRFFAEMEKWLESRGYTKLPVGWTANLPEVSVDELDWYGNSHES